MPNSLSRLLIVSAVLVLVGVGVLVARDRRAAPLAAATMRESRPRDDATTTTVSSTTDAPTTSHLAQAVKAKPQRVLGNGTQTMVPLPDDATVLQNNDPSPNARVRVTRSSPWEAPGLCGTSSPAKVRAWLSYLRTFRRVTTGHAELTVYADPAVGPKLVDAMGWSLDHARFTVASRTSLNVPPPVAYVHRDTTTLRAHSCLTGSAVAFYDGAIHVADTSQASLDKSDLHYSILHEYTHHALIVSGIREPVWFQEGLAMHVSQEPWRDFDITPPGVNVDEMVDAFPYTVSAKVAERLYGQAYQMVAFLELLCGSKLGCGTRGLVAKLRDGADPETFFESTIQELAPNSDHTPLALWQMYFSNLVPG